MRITGISRGNTVSFKRALKTLSRSCHDGNRRRARARGSDAIKAEAEGGGKLEEEAKFTLFDTTIEVCEDEEEEDDEDEEETKRS